MDLVYIFTAMEIDTKVLLLIALNMDLGMKKMQKAISIKETSREDKKMAMGSTTGQMAATTVETLEMEKSKARDYGNQVFKVNITKVHIEMERDKVLVCICGLMV